MAEKGGVSVLTLYCIFNNNGESITHYMNESEEEKELAATLPNTYVVMVANNATPNGKKIVAGFVLKTSYSHNDEKDFKSVCAAVASQKPEMSVLVNNKTTFYL